jgi:hypothetical protein
LGKSSWNSSLHPFCHCQSWLCCRLRLSGHSMRQYQRVPSRPEFETLAVGLKYLTRRRCLNRLIESLDHSNDTKHPSEVFIFVNQVPQTPHLRSPLGRRCAPPTRNPTRREKRQRAKTAEQPVIFQRYEIGGLQKSSRFRREGFSGIRVKKSDIAPTASRLASPLPTVRDPFRETRFYECINNAESRFRARRRGASHLVGRAKSSISRPPAHTGIPHNRAT